MLGFAKRCRGARSGGIAEHSFSDTIALKRTVEGLVNLAEAPTNLCFGSLERSEVVLLLHLGRFRSAVFNVIFEDVSIFTVMSCLFAHGL